MSLPKQPISPFGLPVSELIAGFWRLKHWGMQPKELLTYIEQLVDLGVTTVDHAMVYGSEPPFGQALALKPSIRQQLQIVTKCGIRPVGFGVLGAQVINHYDSSYGAIIQSAEASLQTLGTDYLDLLLLHRPDFLMDVEQVAKAFSQLKAAGKVRYFGVSNFTTEQFALLQQAWPEGLVTNQIEFSPYAIAALGQGVFEQCSMHSIRPMLWSCLGGGSLMNPTNEKGRRILQALEQVQLELEAKTADQVAYAWVRSLPCKPLALIGSSVIDRVRLAVEATQLQLSREQWYRIWEASNGAAVP